LNGDVEIRAIARDSQGNESEPFVQVYRFDNTAPPVPAGVEAMGGLLSASVSWEPVSAGDLKQYKIYFGTEPDCLEYWTTVNSFTHSVTKTDLEPGRTVYFAVSAVDNLGNESTLSQVVSAKPIFDTVSPEMVSLSPAPGTRLSGKVNLQAVATDDSKVATITFFYAPQGSEDWQVIKEETPYYDGTHYRASFQWDTAGLNGNYSIKAVAVDRGGNTDSLTTTILLDNTAPPVPEGLTAVSKSGIINLSWQAVVSDDITQYKIYRRVDSGQWIFIKTVPANILSYTDSNVSIGVTYYYAVTALDDLNNESAKSEEAGATVSDYAPVLTVTPASAGPEATLTFKGTGFKPGENVTLYMDENTFIRSAKTDAEGNITITWLFTKNVFPGVHIFTLTGSSSGVSAQAEFMANVILLPAPQVSVDPAQVEIDLSWGAVPGNIDYYRIYRSHFEGDTWSEYLLIADKVKKTTLSYQDINVKVGGLYRYQVAAVDIYGNEGARSEAVDVAPFEDTTPPVISNFTTYRTGDILKLSVDASDNIGVSVVSFAYYLNGTWQELPLVPVDSGRNVKVPVSINFDTSHLADGYYDLRVRAYDAAGNASIPLSTIVYIRTSAPDTPLDLRAVAGEMRVDVVWGKVDDAEFDCYRLYRRTEGGEFVLLLETKLLSFIDTNVEAGVSYTYQVTAVDTYGHESAPALSDTVTVLPDTTPPEISGFVPADGSRINGEVNISAVASDNVKLTGIDFAYSIDGSIGCLFIIHKKGNFKIIKSSGYTLVAHPDDKAGTSPIFQT
jgi:fibronectin type 3 domain-containing protein